MTNYSAARINMVDSQIHTMGVVNDNVLNAFRTVPREEFVPEDRKGIAYCDEDMPISSGRWLMEPVTHARLMQAAGPLPTDTVLDVACATGYSTAIFSGLTASVVGLEPDAELLALAEANWKKGGYSNIVSHMGLVAEGHAPQAPYSLIFVNGSLCEVPPSLLGQLAPEGRLLAVIKKRGDKIGRATLFLKSSTGALSERVLFDAAVPCLPGFEPRNDFVF